MVWLALKLAAGRVWTIMRSIPPLWAAIALLAATSAYLWHNSAQWKAKAQSCATGRASDRAAYVAAQADATRIATDAKHKTEAANEAARKESDERLAIAKGDADSRLADYVRSHRLRTTSTAQSVASGPDMPGTSQSPQGGDRPGKVADVAISEADILICNENTVRAVETRAWWQSLEGAQ